MTQRTTVSILAKVLPILLLRVYMQGRALSCPRVASRGPNLYCSSTSSLNSSVGIRSWLPITLSADHWSQSFLELVKKSIAGPGLLEFLGQDGWVGLAPQGASQGKAGEVLTSLLSTTTPC